jgi:hypothetical protein
MEESNMDHVPEIVNAAPKPGETLSAQVTMRTQTKIDAKLRAVVMMCSLVLADLDAFRSCHRTEFGSEGSMTCSTLS